MIAPSDRVWALVSGFPGDKRRLRGLMVLQAHIDGSTTKGVVLVLAGYVAPAEKWARFSDDWAEMLTALPPLQRPFKMKNMWCSPERLESTSWLYRIIERHASAAISCAVKIDELHKVWDSITWPPSARDPQQLRNPYYCGFLGLINGVAQAQAQIGLSEPIDFIFDEETEKGPILGGWDGLKENSHPELRPFLGDTPAWKNDETLMPLQAADLYAWWVRKWYVERAPEWWQHWPFPWRLARKEFPRIHVTMAEPDFRQLLGRHLEKARLIAATDPRWAAWRAAQQQNQA